MPQWKLSTEFTFDAAHLIRDYDGPYCPHSVMGTDFRTLRWAKRDMLKGELDHCVLNEVLPEVYETTAEMTAQYIHERNKKEVLEGVKPKVCVSETPNSWVKYEDDD